MTSKIALLLLLLAVLWTGPAAARGASECDIQGLSADRVERGLAAADHGQGRPVEAHRLAEDGLAYAEQGLVGLGIYTLSRAVLALSPAAPAATAEAIYVMLAELHVRLGAYDAAACFAQAALAQSVRQAAAPTAVATAAATGDQP